MLEQRLLDPSSSGSFTSGARNRSSLDKICLHIGQCELVLFTIPRMQLWQYICVQLVMTVSVGGHKQIGQSKSSPSSTNEANFFNSSGFLDTSA